jgi:hypothetical protein
MSGQNHAACGMVPTSETIVAKGVAMVSQGNIRG